MESAQDHATAVIKKLVGEGYNAYFAGGWVRDFLMGHPSSDIDIATDAPPEKVLSLFPRTIKVGLSFGVVIVSIEHHLFEVATFRKDIHYADGRKPSRIELSTAKEDAFRRDFTINGMFYDPLKGEILDSYNRIQHAETTGTGTGVLGDTKTINTYEQSGTYSLSDRTKPMNGNIETYDAGDQEDSHCP